MPMLRILRYNGSLVTWTVGRLTAAKFGSWSSLYSDGRNLIENTASHSSSIVVCVSFETFTWLLLSHRLATVVFTELFHSNGCLCWFHNSGIQQTCCNIKSGAYRHHCSVCGLQRSAHHTSLWRIEILVIQKTCMEEWNLRRQMSVE
jgi:hypothetical protein